MDGKGMAAVAGDDGGARGCRLDGGGVVGDGSAVGGWQGCRMAVVQEETGGCQAWVTMVRWFCGSGRAEEVGKGGEYGGTWKGAVGDGGTVGGWWCEHNSTLLTLKSAPQSNLFSVISFVFNSRALDSTFYFTWLAHTKTSLFVLLYSNVQQMNSASLYSNKLICDDQVTFRSLDYCMSSQSFVPKDPMNDMMEYQCESADNMIAFGGLSDFAPYIGTESTQTHALIGPYTNNAIDMGSGTFYDPIELAELPFYCPYQSTGSTRHDMSMVGISFMEFLFFLLNYLMPKEEVASTEPYMNMERHHAEHALKQINTYPVQGVKMEEVHESHSFLNCKASTSNVVPRRFSKTYQRRSRSSDEYKRRTLIAEKMHVLQELLPESFKSRRGDEEAIVDNAVAHVKYLQLQLKELCRSKLGGGSHSAPLSYLEGFGHYHPQDQLIREPLEKEIGSLIQENQATTLQLLESKGLHMMPMTSIDALRCSL
ncbi:hypothetical protein KSS87_020483 [Heliosperma pusillum]|nr:hypothetical protein KSS87_020483 [Heliosperma pusillum]